jgi:predicted phosphodiesterase
MFTIAHVSDPHVNLRFHPSHLQRLRTTLEHALMERGADHIVITGDLSSDAELRDLEACRKLFDQLGILNPEKLSLVIGNHDIFGGPHLAEDLLGFPSRCTSRDYNLHVRTFAEVFKEAFDGVHRSSRSVFPYAKLVGTVAFVGLNSIARHGVLRNPVGSNGEIDEDDRDMLKSLLKLDDVKAAKYRIVLLHHHLFRRKDEEQFADQPVANGFFQRLELETLKLRGKDKLFKLLEAGKVDAALHGHVHFTAEYHRKGILCLNGAGAICPTIEGAPLAYNILQLSREGIVTENVKLPIKRRRAQRA